jgi:hypothetical protein
MDAPNHRPETLLQTARIVWYGLFSTPFLLLIVVWIVISPSQSDLSAGRSATDPIFLVLCLVAIVDFFLAQNLHRFVKFPNTTQPTSLSQAEPGDLQRGFSWFIVRLALFEAIALLGFVAALLRTNVVLYLPFLLLSLAGLLISSPTEALLKNLANPKR